MVKKTLFQVMVLFLSVAVLMSGYAYAEPGWVGRTMEATGQGVIDTNNPSLGQAKLFARRAATLGAKRDLLEQVLDLKLDSGDTIRDVVTETDAADVYSSGLILGAVVTSETFESGMCTVKIELKLQEVYDYLVLNDLASQKKRGGQVYADRN
ncbi:MAG: hypothetical protein KKF93_02970 [Candidatus Omnitrophica bacterium]|nr:hypothetical protein [Candidatus Omnitrophota bacterium]